MADKEGRTIVIALGGNALIRENGRSGYDDQYSNMQLTAKEIADLLVEENRVVVTYGNGPQVGNLLLASETAKNVVPVMPLYICGAATQGFIGCMLQNALANHLRQLNRRHYISTVITHVLVDENDAAFLTPTKPIGPFYSEEEAEALRNERGWTVVRDSNRGYRRVVPSPKPLSIQQERIIRSLLDMGEIVIAVGGGGIPVVRGSDGLLHGVEAVVDKDYASCRLAMDMDADIFLILTTVERVCCDFGRPSQRPLDTMTVAEAKRLLADGQFATGSMEPKIRAALDFLEGTKGPPGTSSGAHHQKEVIITLPEMAMAAMEGKAGTRITW